MDLRSNPATDSKFTMKDRKASKLTHCCAPLLHLHLPNNTTDKKSPPQTMASTSPSTSDYASHPRKRKCGYYYEYEEEEDVERPRILYQQADGASRSNLSDDGLPTKVNPPKSKYPFNPFNPPNKYCLYIYKEEEEEDAELAHFLYQQPGGLSKADFPHDGDKSLTIMAPKQALANPPAPQPSDRFKVFTPFPFLPAEIRHKIWALTLPGPQVLHIVYDTRIRGEADNSYFEVKYHGRWRVANGIQIPVCLHVCQEARFYVLKGFNAEYDQVNLVDDVTKWACVNFETDTFFFDTNARPSDLRRVLPPRKFPLARKFWDRVRWAAVGEALWGRRGLGWNFVEDWGSDVSYECCARHGVDETHEKFKDQFCDALEHAESIQVVEYTTDDVGDSDWIQLESCTGELATNIADAYAEDMGRFSYFGIVDLVKVENVD
ncbi:hypothetical protein B7494_g286 [Chlorociboria aeruginascens]|nr:hypothetical protein B7494_g286 [Chlorociboria aeruginascens]